MFCCHILISINTILTCIFEDLCSTQVKCFLKYPTSLVWDQSISIAVTQPASKSHSSVVFNMEDLQRPPHIKSSLLTTMWAVSAMYDGWRLLMCYRHFEVMEIAAYSTALWTLCFFRSVSPSPGTTEENKSELPLPAWRHSKPPTLLSVMFATELKARRRKKEKKKKKKRIIEVVVARNHVGFNERIFTVI